MRRRPRTFRRRQRNLVWLPSVGPGLCSEPLTVNACSDVTPTDDLFLLAAAARASSQATLVDAPDEATVLRIVGNLAVFAACNCTQSGTHLTSFDCAVGIYISDLSSGDLAAGATPQDLNPMMTEDGGSKDWLWRGYWNCLFQTTLTTGGVDFDSRSSNEDGYWKDLDIRVKRRLTPNEAIILSFCCTHEMVNASEDIVPVAAFNGDLRMLVKVG